MILRDTNAKPKPFQMDFTEIKVKIGKEIRESFTTKLGIGSLITPMHADNITLAWTYENQINKLKTKMTTAEHI